MNEADRDRSTAEACLERAYLESALEEQLGGATPPDLSARTLAAAEQQRHHGPSASPTRRWQWLVAAVVLVAAGITMGIWWTRSGDLPRDKNRPTSNQDPGNQDSGNQDPGKQDKKPTNPKVVEPRSPAECRQLLGQVCRITARMHVLGKHRIPAKIPDSPPAPEVELMIPGEPLTKTVAAMAACIEVRPDTVQWTRPHDLYLYLPDGRRLQAAVADGRFYVRGLGTFAASKQLTESLRAVLVAGEISTKTELGILHLDEINDSGVLNYGCVRVDARHVRACGLGSADVNRLSRFRELESVDLRLSPDAHTLEDMRALVAMDNLRKVYLNGFKITPAHLEILGDKTQIQELILLDRNEAYWRSGIRPSASRVDDSALDHIVKMSGLRVLVLPGATITRKGLRKLATLHELHTLVLTGAPLVTGAGFVHFRANSSLKVLHLGYCKGLTDVGMAEVARLPGLEELYLEGARSQTSSNKKRSNLNPASLEHLAKAPRLRRLALGRWFCRRMTHPIIYRNKEVTGFEPTAAMLQALNGMARGPRMEMLSLADCTDLALDDLKAVCRGARALRLLDLSAIVGPGPGRIPVEGVGELMNLIPHCSVVYQD